MAAPAGNVNPNFTSASLYVGDLGSDVTEALLFEIFNAVGPVASIRVCRDATSRRSLGYAYVNFHNVVDAERALDTMNFHKIRTRPCRIMWSQRDPSLRKSGIGNIFVKNLDKSIDHKTLYDTFSMFGNILSCKVATGNKGESLGYGFVHYETQEAASKAIDKVDGMVIAAKKVYVAPFRPRSERGDPSERTFTNIYVKGLPEETTEEVFDQMFKKFGDITSIMLIMGDEKCKGFGFINYEKPEQAQQAVDAMNEKEIEEGQKLFVGRAQKKTERQQLLAVKFEKLRVERQKKFQGVNLYVKNLDDSVTEEELKTEFETCGDISSVKIMRDAANRSRGFGFVCFSTPEEATKAMREMNGKIVSNKPLYVARAQRKEERRAMLEARMAARNRSNMPMFPPGAPMYYQPAHAAAAAAAAGVRPPNQFNLYPQQMQGPRGGRPPFGMGPMGMRPIHNMYGGIPHMQPRQQMDGQGGRRRNGGKRMQQQGGQQGNYKFNTNARNAGPPPQQQQQSLPQQQPAPQAPQQPQQTMVAQSQPLSPSEPLTSQALASAPAHQQKQMIGERIFPLIQKAQPDLAGKITGMLLEMDNTELLHLLQSPEALGVKIEEAMLVLQAHVQPKGSVVETQEAGSVEAATA